MTEDQSDKNPSTASDDQEKCVPVQLQPRRHPGFGLMKELTTIAPGTDLTAPLGGEWNRTE